MGVWYRALNPGDTSGVLTFSAELQKHRDTSLGTLCVGDFNVHNRKWLVHSARNSPEGKALEETCSDLGLRQLVREPTRENYLLDLVLTDLEGVSCKVLPGVADHALVSATLKLQVPKTEAVEREVWVFSKANWTKAKELLAETDWTYLDNLDADTAAAHLEERILAVTRDCVPKRLVQDRKSAHPWLTPETRTGSSKAQSKRNSRGDAGSKGVQRRYTPGVHRVRTARATRTLNTNGWLKEVVEA